MDLLIFVVFQKVVSFPKTYYFFRNKELGILLMPLERSFSAGYQIIVGLNGCHARWLFGVTLAQSAYTELIRGG